MAKSRRTEKQQLLKDYETLLQEERAEEERLQREDDEFWAQKLEYEHYLYEQKIEERRLCEVEDFNDDFEGCWTDDDPWHDDYPWSDYNW